MLYKTSLLLLSCCLATAIARGQTMQDSTHILKGVTIASEKIICDQSRKEVQPDTLLLMRLMDATISGVLSNASGIYMRDYGPGNISILSLNGSGPAHTAVYWNKIPLNSSMHGVTDLSIQPSFFMDHILLTEGGDGSNGAVAGSLNLYSSAKYDTVSKLLLYSGLGSFGSLQSGIGLSLTNGKVYTNTRIYRASAENNFPTHDADGNSRNQPHANYLQRGIAEDAGLSSKWGQLEFHAQLLDADRLIPPLMLNQQSDRRQKDRSIRLTFSYSKTLRKCSHTVSCGFLHDGIIYSDAAASIADTSKAKTWLLQYELQYELAHSLFLTTSVSCRKSTAHVTEYAQEKNVRQEECLAQLKWQHQSTIATASLRYSLTQGNGKLLLPELGVLQKINALFSARANVARVYRLPTLNDLYWQPGGNPALKPEEGYSSTAALLAQKKWGTRRIESELGLFYSALEQAIVWIPNDDGLYTAYNIHVLRNRGLQTSAGFSTLVRKADLSWQVDVHYTESSIIRSSTIFADAIDKQMIYVPKWTTKTTFIYSQNGWQFQYAQQFVGIRYTETDNSKWLPSFSTADVTLTKKIVLPHVQLNAGIVVRNLFNTQYQYIAWQAMPGRSFGVHIVAELLAR